MIIGVQDGARKLRRDNVSPGHRRRARPVPQPEPRRPPGKLVTRSLQRSSSVHRSRRERCSAATPLERVNCSLSLRRKKSRSRGGGLNWCASFKVPDGNVGPTPTESGFSRTRRHFGCAVHQISVSGETEIGQGRLSQSPTIQTRTPSTAPLHVAPRLKGGTARMSRAALGVTLLRIVGLHWPRQGHFDPLGSTHYLT